MGDPFVEVLGPLRRLRTRVAAEFAQRGLRVVEFAVAPGAEVNGPHEVHVLAVAADGEPPAETERDEAFNQVMEQARQAEIEEQNRRVEEQLRDRMDRDDGFL